MSSASSHRPSRPAAAMTPAQRSLGSLTSSRLSWALSSRTKATWSTASSSIVASDAAIASSPRWPTKRPIVTYSRRATSSAVICPMSAGAIEAMRSEARRGSSSTATSARNGGGILVATSTALAVSSSPASRADSRGPNARWLIVAVTPAGRSRLAAASRPRALPLAS